MKIVRSISDIERFNAVIDQCKGDVYLQSTEGDRYNLKSSLTRYVALADLLRDEEGKLELFASLPEDESRLIGFLSTLD